MPRTDLALELAQDIEPEKMAPEDFSSRTVRRGPVSIHFMHIRSSRAGERFGVPTGRYITAEIPALTDHTASFLPIAETVGAVLRGLLPVKGTVLVVGLGNAAVTPDALGPQTVRRVLATRHIRGEYARATGLTDLRPVVTAESGVLGNTGLESGELVRGLVSVTDPGAVIAVDALAARSLQRLGCTIQMNDSGIVPGSGVGNSREALNRDMLGIPVISLGVPTVVDAATLAEDLTGRPFKQTTAGSGQMMVTPREIDLMIHRASRLLAMVINAALQPRYAADEVTDAAQ
ncbi:MAG: GPR endopeptidase [Clostridia bacterium]|nr:GPR endopeptidase [Clostridia bacterium]